MLDVVLTPYHLGLAMSHSLCNGREDSVVSWVSRKCVLGGKQAVAGGQRVSPSRGDLQRGPAGHPLARLCVQVHSRSITKNILVVWRNRQRLRPTRTLGRPLCRCRSRATLAAVSRKVRVFELVRREGDAGRRDANPPIANARTTARARYWFFRVAAMTSGTGVRSAPSLVS